MELCLHLRRLNPEQLEHLGGGVDAAGPLAALEAEPLDGDHGGLGDLLAVDLLGLALHLARVLRVRDGLEDEAVLHVDDGQVRVAERLSAGLAGALVVRDGDDGGGLGGLVVELEGRLVGGLDDDGAGLRRVLEVAPGDGRGRVGLARAEDRDDLVLEELLQLGRLFGAEVFGGVLEGFARRLERAEDEVGDRVERAAGRHGELGREADRHDEARLAALDVHVDAHANVAA